MTSQQKCHFFMPLPSFLFLVWFCIYTHVQLRILKFQDCVYQESIAMRTDRKRVEKIET